MIDIAIDCLLFLLPLFIPILLCFGLILFKNNSNSIQGIRENDTTEFEPTSQNWAGIYSDFINELPLALISFYLWSLTVSVNYILNNLSGTIGADIMKRAVLSILLSLFLALGHFVLILMLGQERFSLNRRLANRFCYGSISIAAFLRIWIWFLINQ